MDIPEVIAAVSGHDQSCTDSVREFRSGRLERVKKWKIYRTVGSSEHEPTATKMWEKAKCPQIRLASIHVDSTTSTYDSHRVVLLRLVN